LVPVLHDLFRLPRVIVLAVECRGRARIDRHGDAIQVQRLDHSIDHSSDVHHQATLLRAWDQEYTQLHPGRFSGYVRKLRNDGIKLFSERMNRAVFQMGALPATRLAFGLPLHASDMSCLCGEDGDKNSLLVFSGRSGFEFFSPDDFEFFGIEIDVDASSDPVLSTMIESLDKIISCGKRSIALNPNRAAKLGRFLDLTLSEEGIAERILNWPDHAAAFNRGLVGWLLDMLQTADSGSDRRQIRHWDAITEIRTLVSEAPCCPISVAELTVELGVSRRTLQNACQEIVGLSPVQYLRALRLSEARRMMERSSSVTEAATQFGFWHLGYFARDYHAMFGELPSCTLNRYRRYQT